MGRYQKKVEVGDDVFIESKMGRPRKPIDWKEFEKLCFIQCTHDEIASFCEVAKSTLYERAEREYGENFPTVYKRFSEGGKSSLRRDQFAMAKKNCSMAIWLGKQYLGQRDKFVEDENVENLEKLAASLSSYLTQISRAKPTVGQDLAPEQPILHP